MSEDPFFFTWKPFERTGGEGAHLFTAVDLGALSDQVANMATPENPHGVASCGTITMSGGLWIRQGLIHNVAPEKWQP